MLAYRFAHSSLWKVARSRLEERRQRRFHLLAGAFLERSGAHYSRLIRHYEMSGDAEKALGELALALTECLDREELDEARYWFRRCQSAGERAPEKLRADHVFPPPWGNLGWRGVAPDTGLRHFLAAQWICLDRPEEALWQLQITLEQGLEDDPPGLVENLLLRATVRLRGLGLHHAEAEHCLDEATALANQHGLKDRLPLIHVLRSRLEKAHRGRSRRATGSG